MLNEVDADECELCGGVRHLELHDDDDDDYGMNIKTASFKSSVSTSVQPSEDSKATTLRKQQTSSSTYTGTSKSSEASSNNNNKSLMDPPAATEHRALLDAPSADRGDKRRGSSKTKNMNTHRRVSMSDQHIRRASIAIDKKDKEDDKLNYQKKKKKGGSNIINANTNIATGAAAIQSLSTTPLPGEDTPKAIAQLLGLTDRVGGNGSTTDGDTTTINNDTKYSGSKGSSTAHRKSVKSQPTLKNKSKRRATFSQEVVRDTTPSNNDTTMKSSYNTNTNNNNSAKLNKKIAGDRVKAEEKKNAARHRGEIIVAEREDVAVTMAEYELRAGAKEFVPIGIGGGSHHKNNSGRDQNGQSQKQQPQQPSMEKKNSRGKKKKNAKNNITGENDPSSNNDKQLQKAVNTMTADDEQIIPKQSKKKNKGQQQQQFHSIEPAGSANLTLQAIQQSKQQQKKAQKTEKTNEKDISRKQSDKSNGKQSEHRPDNAVNNDKKKPNVQPNKERNNAKSTKKKKSDKNSDEKKMKAAAVNGITNLSPAIPPNQPQTTNDLNYGAGRPVVVVHIAEKPSIAQVSITLLIFYHLT